MRPFLSILAASEFFLSTACTTTASAPMPQPADRCQVTSLAEVFRNAVSYNKKRFCGWAVAYRRGRAIEIFPEGRRPDDPSHTALLPDTRTSDRLLREVTSEAPRRVHLEGVFDLMKECFEVNAAADPCFPYTYPIHLKVSSYQLGGKP